MTTVGLHCTTYTSSTARFRFWESVNLSGTTKATSSRASNVLTSIFIGKSSFYQQYWFSYFTDCSAQWLLQDIIDIRVSWKFQGHSAMLLHANDALDVHTAIYNYLKLVNEQNIRTASKSRFHPYASSRCELGHWINFSKHRLPAFLTNFSIVIHPLNIFLGEHPLNK